MPKPEPGQTEAIAEADFTHRSRCLKTANYLINGERDVQHGSPIANFSSTAGMWTEYLAERLAPGVRLEPHDVAAMMVLLKVSRLRASPGKEDHWVDIAGYAGCGMECAILECEYDQEGE
jgi:hypothetical protein